VAWDMRQSSEELSKAFIDGVLEQGTDVVALGLTSTDLIYFAAGKLDAPGAMFTASHNPAQYGGIKLCLAGARPVGEETGLQEIKRMVAEGGLMPGGERGTLSAQNLLDEYAAHVRSFPAKLLEYSRDELVPPPQFLDLGLRTADNHDYALAAAASSIIMSSSCATLSDACAPFTTRNVGRSR